jgi:hypothetical protein
VLRLGLTAADQWNGVNSGLIQVMTSIQHSFAPDQQAIDRANQQLQQSAQTEQQVDNVINGVQEVQDPSTGTIYRAPYDSYAQHGPDGPGYYLDEHGTLVKLQVINHE